MLLKKIVLGLSVIGVFGGLAVVLSMVSASHAQGLPRLMFVQRDKVIKFDPTTGVGLQVGTASGLVEGVTTVNFQFAVTFPPNFTFNNRAGITDLDGDQIIFKNVGSGLSFFRRSRARARREPRYFKYSATATRRTHSTASAAHWWGLTKLQLLPASTACCFTLARHFRIEALLITRRRRLQSQEALGWYTSMSFAP